MTNPFFKRYNTIGRGSEITQPPEPPFPPIIEDGNTVGWYDSQIIGTGGIIKDGGDFVSRWEDRLLSGRDLLQIIGTRQPKWFLNDGVLFDGGDDSLQAIFTLNQPEFIYVVFKHITWVIAKTIFDGIASQSGTLWQWGVTPELQAYAGIRSTNEPNLALNTYGIARILFNGATSKLIINSSAPIIGDFGSSNMGGFTLGSAGAGNIASNIQVKEVMVRKIADTAQNEQDIYNYLANKYSI